MTTAEKLIQLVKRAQDLVDDFEDVLAALDDVGQHLVGEFIYAVSNLDGVEEYLDGEDKK